MAHFSATCSASDRPVSPYNSGTEARIEAPQAPEDRGHNMILITPFGLKMSYGRFSLARSHIFIISI